MSNIYINDVLDLSKKYSTINILNHEIRVCNFSLTLFNHLIKDSKLDDDDKSILLCASLLHDIGKFYNKDLHHKLSMQIILSDKSFNTCLKELRDPIAIVAFSHRKLLWDDLFLLNEPIKSSLLMIISILRIADGLDYHKSEDVKIVDIHNTSKYLKLKLSCKYSIGMNKVLNHKKTLFEETFKKHLIIEYNYYNT